MMQQPKIVLGFAYTRCRANSRYNFWKRSRLSEKKRAKERVTPEFGVRKEEKILPPNSGRYSKLAPRYVGPYQIQAKRGEVAYQLNLPESLSAVHNVFHVSQLKKCLRVPEEQLSVEDLEVQEDLTYIEKPTQILEFTDRITRRKTIRMCKVRWGHHSEEEATWEREDDLKAKYPELFADQP
jgi:hypothetical protein